MPAGLGNLRTYERCATLNCLGQCFRSQGEPDLAEKSYREALAIAVNLEPSGTVKNQQGALQTELGNVLTDVGRYVEARAAYDASLADAKRLGDLRAEGVVNAQLGALALAQRGYPTAIRRYGAALSLFQRLKEPAGEAIYRHQLGIALEEAGQREEAEKHYRESARIAEARGDPTGAAHSWHQLALVSKSAGKLQATEAWYRKALGGYRAGGAAVDLSKTLKNLANLLMNGPGRLAEARQLAEESFAIQKAHDPGAAQTWTTYDILAEIADRQNDPTQAAAYRRQARPAYRNFIGSRYELQKYTRLIAAVLVGVGGHLAAQQAVSREQKVMHQAGSVWARLAQAIDQILAGQRDADVLTANLDALPSMIVEAILEGTKDPARLEVLLGTHV